MADKKREGQVDPKKIIIEFVNDEGVKRNTNLNAVLCDLGSEVLSDLNCEIAGVSEEYIFSKAYITKVTIY